MQVPITIFDRIRQFLFSHIVTQEHGSKWLVEFILLAGVAAMAVIGYYVMKLLLGIIDKVVRRTPTDWDEDLLNPRMLNALSQLAPAMIVKWLLPGVFRGWFNDVLWLQSLTSIYIVGTLVWIVCVFLTNLRSAFAKRDNLRMYAVKGIFQMFKLVAMAIGVIIAVSILLHKSPVVILTALGASAAVLILIFQDTILGWVTSVQFMANNLLHHGDWIEDKTHDVNGRVEDINLSAVKIKNWDNSISVVPPYLLLKNSFRNYRNINMLDCRRIARAIYIDMNTVGFCDRDRSATLLEAGFITEEEVGQRMVNLTLLRHYLQRYLDSHPKVEHTQLMMVRQLDPTNAGLPLQLYFFVNTSRWAIFEETVSDIFDHVYAVVHEFGLSIFQTPAGTDLSRASDCDCLPNDKEK